MDPCDRLGSGACSSSASAAPWWGRTGSSPKRSALTANCPRVARHRAVLRRRHRAGVGAAPAAGPEADLSGPTRRSPTRSGCGTTSRAAPPARCTPTPAPTSTAIAEGRYRDAYLIARAPEPVRLDLRPGVRRAVRDGLPAGHRRRADRDPGPQALRHRAVRRRELRRRARSGTRPTARCPPATLGSVGVVGGGPAGLERRLRAAPRRPPGHGLRGHRPARRDDGARHPRVPPRPRAHRPRDRRDHRARASTSSCRSGSAATSRSTSCSPGTNRCSCRSAPGRGRDLDLPGHELDGVLRAVEFLLNVNQGFRVDLGQRVVVVGGGNVAFDAARTALRAAARRAAATRTRRIGARSPARADDARRGMITTSTWPAPPSAPACSTSPSSPSSRPRRSRPTPRRSPRPRPRASRSCTARARTASSATRPGHRASRPSTCSRCSTTSAASTRPSSRAPRRCSPADTVILAVGQTRRPRRARRGSTSSSTRGGIRTDPATLRTSHPRIWAGGDVAHGPRNLIDAIADGQRAAASSTLAAPTPRRPRASGSS